MTIYPYRDVDESEIIQDSNELSDLTTELRSLLDDLDLPRPQRDRLASLIRDRDRETGRLAYRFGVRAGDLNARLLGRLRRRDNEKGAGG